MLLRSRKSTGLSNPCIACRKLWSLSDEEGDLSHNFLTLQNGLQLHYLSPRSTPQSCKTLVIFLHGFPDSSYLWEQYLASGLAQKAKLVALDLPGCGGSDSHSFYGPDEILNAVAEAIVQVKRRYLNQPEASSSPMKTILVSHDWYGSSPASKSYAFANTFQGVVLLLFASLVKPPAWLMKWSF